MCGGASYIHHGEHMRVYFPNPKAKLPVIVKNNETKLMLWVNYRLEDGQD